VGVFLRAVTSLLSLRLAHKSASKRAPRGSAEASHHDALQAAMKLMINSAYGYLGAGGMALFADREAADEVTRRGRELLSNVLDALRSRGATLIEADTDGVYFAVAEGTTEDEERAIVTFAGKDLPEGVHLEFEGRYRAMLSYEVKNYALLGYDGALAVRGVALGSSRSEPFGERFLHEALGAALRGDVQGVRDAFVRVVHALRRRELSTFDVTTRVRITKGPDEYRRTRATHKEAPYEALMSAGRASWSPGERVRYYRSKARGYVWLPDDSDAPDPRDYDVEHYLGVLVRSYASRLAPAFRRDDWEHVFRISDQLGLFEPSLASLELRRVGDP
jgi:DNA polymerase elongation subunit (family B)